MVGEVLDLSRPERLILGEPFGRASQGCGVKPAIPRSASLLDANKTSIVEYTDVFGDGCLTHVKRLGQLRQAGLALHQTAENRSTGLVAERIERGVEMLKLNHKVDYNSNDPYGQPNGSVSIGTPAGNMRRRPMGDPIVHFEIRSSDAEAGRNFYRELFGWAFIEAPPEHVDGYTYIDSQTDRATIHGGLSSPQGGEPLVTVYAEVDDIEASLAKVVSLGGTVVQSPTEVPGVTIGLFADPEGNVVGVAQPRR